MVACRDTLSIIVIAHNEGVIADQTMRSLFDAERKAESLEIEYEFLVNIDRGNKETINYFEELSKEKNISLNYTDYGDPGLARNDAVKKARGKYIAMIDADDVVSSNWLYRATKMIIGSNEKRLVHPEIEIRYNTEKIESINWRMDLEDNWADNLALVLGNRWCSVMLGEREVFLKYPYSASNNGFGYEDYYFNCNTIDAGVRHLIVKGTTVFCLQKKTSITKKTHAHNYVLPYTKLFDFRKMKRKYRKSKGIDLITERKTVKAPSFVLAQTKEFELKNNCSMRMSAEINNMKIDKLSVFEDVGIGVLFVKMIDSFNAKKAFKAVAFVHNLVEYKESLDRGADVFIVVDDSDNFVTNNNVLNLHKFFNRYPNWVQHELITKILMQLKIEKIMTFGNSVGTEWCEAYKDFLQLNNIQVEKLG